MSVNSELAALLTKMNGDPLERDSNSDLLAKIVDAYEPSQGPAVEFENVTVIVRQGYQTPPSFIVVNAFVFEEPGRMESVVAQYDSGSQPGTVAYVASFKILKPSDTFTYPLILCFDQSGIRLSRITYIDSSDTISTAWVGSQQTQILQLNIPHGGEIQVLLREM